MPDIPPTEAVEAAKLALIDHHSTWVGDWPGGTTCERCGPIETSTERHMAEAALAAALPHLPQRVTPSVEEVARWLYGQRHLTAFRDQAHELLALFSSQPTAEDVRREALAEAAKALGALPLVRGESSRDGGLVTLRFADLDAILSPWRAQAGEGGHHADSGWVGPCCAPPRTVPMPDRVRLANRG